MTSHTTRGQAWCTMPVDGYDLLVRTPGTDMVYTSDMRASVSTVVSLLQHYGWGDDRHESARITASHLQTSVAHIMQAARYAGI